MIGVSGDGLGTAGATSVMMCAWPMGIVAPIASVEKPGAPVRVAIVTCASALPLFVRMMNCEAGAAPPQSAAPKSICAVCWPVGGVGQSGDFWPWPTCPEKESDVTLVPAEIPVTLTVEVADAETVVPALRMKPARTSTGDVPGFSVRDTPASDEPESENCGFEGGPTAIVAGAFPEEFTQGKRDAGRRFAGRRGRTDCLGGSKKLHAGAHRRGRERD